MSIGDLVIFIDHHQGKIKMITIKLDLPTALDDANKTRVSKYRWLAKKKKEKKEKNGKILLTRTLSPLPFRCRSSSISLSPRRGNAYAEMQASADAGIERSRQKIDSSPREQGDSISNRSGRGADQNRKWPGFSQLARTYRSVTWFPETRETQDFLFFYKTMSYNLVRYNMENFSILLGSNTKYSNFTYSYFTKF